MRQPKESGGGEAGRLRSLGRGYLAPAEFKQIAYGGASYLVQAPLQRYVLHLSFAKFIASPEWRFFQVSALLSNGRGGETPYGGVGAPVRQEREN